MMNSTAKGKLPENIGEVAPKKFWVDVGFNAGLVQLAFYLEGETDPYVMAIPPDDAEGFADRVKRASTLARRDPTDYYGRPN
jgi:hypothetical protein